MIVREGWLLKRGEHIKNWRARYFILLDDGSLLGYKQKPPQGLYKDHTPTNNFTVRGCHIVKVESPTHFIFVIRGLNSGQEIERNFSAGNHHDRDGWCSAIAETALRLMNELSTQSPILQQQSQLLHQQQEDCDMLDASVLAQNSSSVSAAAASTLQQQNNNTNNNNLITSQQQQANSANQPNSMVPSTGPLNFVATSSTSLNKSGPSLFSQAGGLINSSMSNQANTVSSFYLPGQQNNSNNPQTLHLNSHLTSNNNGLNPVKVSKKMSLDSFNPIRLLGRGTWGKVMLSREKSTGCLYAIKILKKQEVIEQNEVGHTLTENRVLRTTNHPFLIALKYSFRDEGRLCFVMEFASGGELFYHLSRVRIFSEEKTRFYGAEVICALGYLHENEIIYRDLKLENLLLGRDGHIKIADFGLCKDNITYNDTTRTFCGTPEYLSPEVVEDFNYGRAVDWWGLGVLLYEMLCGGLPFNNRSTSQLFDEIVLKEVTFPPTLTLEAKSLLSGLLIKNPSRRLGGGPGDAKEIQVHPFFRGLNWQDLVEKKIPPPFVPPLDSDIDTKYFDRQFTTEPPNLTPIDRPHPSEVDASYFNQFSFTAAGSALSQQQLSSHLN